MRTADAPHRGLAILPEVLGQPIRHQSLGRMPPAYAAMLAALLLPPPLIIYTFNSILLPGRTLHEPLAHMLLEGFCALIALVVFYVLRQEWCCAGGRRLATMAHGFLLYGILNLGHALSPHNSHSFVFLHSIAGNALAMMLLASVIEETGSAERSVPDKARSRRVTLLYALAGFAIAAAGVMLAEYVPWRRVDGSFTAVANGVNVSSAVMFGIAGWVLLRDFRRNHEPIVFCFGLCSLAFAETHALFPLSSLWGVAWWGWHFVKLAIYLGLVLGIAYECVQTLRDSMHGQDVLRERNDELVSAYDKLTRTQESLLRSERLAVLGQMAGMIAHEVRNPLATMFNCLGILKKQSLGPEDAARAIEMMETSADRISRIVDDTLGSARTPVVHRQPVSLAAIVDRSLESLAPEVLGSLDVDKRYGSDPLYVDGTSQQLAQMVTNLIENASDAMNGKGTLTLEVGAEDTVYVLRVTDQGKGIPDDIKERVFEPLFTTKPRGTGLGLAIVRYVAEQHQGTVVIESTSPRGTTITVRLPALVATATPALAVA